MNIVQNYQDRIIDDQSKDQPGLTLTVAVLQATVTQSGQVTSDSGLPTLSDEQRQRTGTAQVSDPSGLLLKLGSGMRQDPGATAGIGVSADTVAQIATQGLTLQGFTAQAQDAEDAANTQADLVDQHTETLVGQIMAYQAKVQAEPPTARPLAERNTILCALRTPEALWTAQRVRQSMNRRANAQRAVPAKQQLALSQQNVQDMNDINQFIDSVHSSTPSSGGVV